MNDVIKYQINNSIINDPTFVSSNEEIKKILGNIPINPEVFIGRNDDIVKIHDTLFNKQNCLLLVNGQGGIGKTTVASSYYHKYIEKYSHLIWIVAENSIEDALLLLGMELQLKFDDKITDIQKIEEIVRNLLMLKSPSLLVIDNANDLNDLENSYPLLRKCSNLHILLTTRITNFSSVSTYPIRHLTKEAAFELFVRHYKDHNCSEDRLLNDILKAVGYNTLVIELLAKNLNNFNNVFEKKYTLQNLLKDLQTKGVLRLTSSKQVNTDYHNFKAEKPEDIIDAMYNISSLQENEQALLSIFSILPTVNIPFSHLEDLLPSIENLSDLALTVTQKGWIEFDQKLKIFKCSPVVQEVVQKQNNNKLFDHCKILLENLTNKLIYDTKTQTFINTSYKQAVIYVQYAEIICQHFSRLRGYSPRLIDIIGTFHMNYGNLNKALIFFEKNKQFLEDRFEENPNNIDLQNALIFSYSKLIDVYISLNDLGKALNFGKNYSKMSQKLYNTDQKNVKFKNMLANSYEKLGKIYLSLGNLIKALEFFEKETILSEELFKAYPQDLDFKNGLASAYSKLGDTHTELGDINKALIFFELSTNLLEELLNINPEAFIFKHGVAILYSKLGDTHISLGNFRKSLNFCENRLILEQELYEVNPQNLSFKNGLAISYEKLGAIHVLLADYPKALKSFMEGVKLAKKLHEKYPQNIKYKNNLAIFYERIGATHISLGDFSEALNFFMYELELTEELFKDDPQSIMFKNNVASTYSKLGEIHTLLGNQDKALTFLKHETTLFENLFEVDPNNVKFKRNLALSYAKRGVFYKDQKKDKSTAYPYLQKAQRLWQELSDASPKNVEFQKHCKQIGQVLSNLT